MEKLWAPWRMAYVEVAKPQGCIFCDKPREDRDEENLILQRGKTAFVIMNAFPYNNGHLMVAPYRHTAELESLSAEERDELMALAQESLRLLQAAFGPNGYNLGMNLGRVAGAGIADHLHLHLVPRWDGDTNFMPVIADTKVLPDSLQSSYRKLREALQQQ
jgi:ATP adenylyltransferase